MDAKPLSSPNESTTENLPRINQLQVYLIPFLLFILGIGIFANTLGSDLLNSWDDNVYITQNPRVQEFSIGKLGEIFTKFYNGEYIPITLTSFAIDHIIWGSNSTGYHLINVLFHAINGVLVYYLIRRIRGKQAIALVTAILFIVHPLQVESVAWVSQRKNVLSMFFFLLSFLFYLNSTRKNANSFALSLAWLCFLLSVLSKPSAIFAPLIFITFDYLLPSVNMSRLVLRNAPFIVIGVIGAVLAYLADRSLGGIHDRYGDGIVESIQLISRSVWDHTTSFILPINLNNLYLYDLGAIRDGDIISWLGILVIIALIVYAILQPSGKPISRLIALWIVVMILPVLSIVPLAILRADRYLYFVSIPIFLIVGIAFERLWTRFQRNEVRYGLASVAGAVVMVLIALTISRNSVWKNSETLWTDHLEDYPNSVVGLQNLGAYYYQTGNFTAARTNLQKLLQLSPNNITATRLMGNVALLEGNYEESIAYYQRTFQLNPSDTPLIDDYGAALVQAGVSAFDDGDYETALQYYIAALEVIPNEPKLHNNIGYTLYTVGQYEQALVAFNRAIELQDEYPRAWVNVGLTALAMGDFNLAAHAYTNALNLGAVFSGQDYSNYCLVLAESGGDAQVAISACNEAISIDRDNPLFLGRAAHVLLLYNQPADALEIARRAVELGPEMSLNYRVLGDALLGVGQVDEARTAFEQALTLDPNNEKAQAALNSLNGTSDGN